MQEINDQVTNPADPDGTLTADEFNDGIKTELQSIVTQTGQTFSQADQTQLGKAISTYAAGGDFYTAGGTADAITLTPVGSKVSPNAYFDGMRVRFVPTAENTGAVTIDVNSLGSVALKTGFGDLTAGNISPLADMLAANSEVVILEAEYNSSAGEFRLTSKTLGFFDALNGRVKDVLIIGTTDSVFGLNGVRSALQLGGTLAQDTTAAVYRFGNASTPARYTTIRSRGADEGNRAIVQVNDIASEFRSVVDDGVDLSSAIGGFSVEVDAVAAPTVEGRFVIASGQAVDRVTVDKDGHIEPTGDGTQNLGGAGNRFDTVYATTGTINTSQKSQKDGFRPIDDALLDVIGDLELQLYQWKTSVDQKGSNSARFHAGAIVDDFIDICKNKGLVDYDQYALFIKDKSYEKEIYEKTEPVIDPETKSVLLDENGDQVTTITGHGYRNVMDENGDPVWSWTYGFRYSQLLVCLTAYERRERLKLADRIEKLEALNVR